MFRKICITTIKFFYVSNKILLLVFHKSLYFTTFPNELLAFNSANTTFVHTHTRSCIS